MILRLLCKNKKKIILYKALSKSKSSNISTFQNFNILTFYDFETALQKIKKKLFYTKHFQNRKVPTFQHFKILTFQNFKISTF